MQILNNKEHKINKDKYDGLRLVIDEILNETDHVFSSKELREDISDRKINSVLYSFKVHDTLNPQIWHENEELDKEVRLSLLQIADEFLDFINVKWVRYDDIILTGSLANYNWSKYSDFDLHIVMDFSKVDEKKEFVKEYFDSKKNLWNNEHEGLTIKGYPVELYVQDINEAHNATGIYSLEREEWIRKPNKKRNKASIDRENVRKKSIKIAKLIDNLILKSKMTRDKHKLELVQDRLNDTYDKVYAMRRKSLVNDGEMGEGNIIFKALRRLGYIDKLRDTNNRLFDRLNSIDK